MKVGYLVSQNYLEITWGVTETKVYYDDFLIKSSWYKAENAALFLGHIFWCLRDLPISPYLLFMNDFNFDALGVWRNIFCKIMRDANEVHHLNAWVITGPIFIPSVIELMFTKIGVNQHYTMKVYEEHDIITFIAWNGFYVELLQEPTRDGLQIVNFVLGKRCYDMFVMQAVGVLNINPTLTACITIIYSWLDLLGRGSIWSG